jgi:tetratricopeptide (TPR) repeat protein
VFNTTLWLEWRLWQASPTGYHVVNLLLHIATSLLLWIVLRRLKIPGAFVAALLFAVHPVNVESVAWITQVKNLLAMLFYLLSILCYVNAEIPPAGVSAAYPWYALSLAAFLLAMLSKGSVAVFPLILVGIILWMRPLTKRDVARLTPFFAVSAALVPVNVWFQSRLLNNRVAAPEPFLDRLLTAAAAVWFYLYKALLPIGLSFFYPHWDVRSDQLLWWLPLLAAVAVTLAFWIYRRTWGRPLLFSWGYFCLCLAPALGFTNVAFLRYSQVADHYQHLALIGIVALVAGVWGAWQQRLDDSERTTANAGAAVVVAILTFLTFQQSALYASAATLYRDSLAKNPDSPLALNNLGTILANTGEPREAIALLEKALQLDPNYVEAHNNLGAALARNGRVAEAMDHYEQALRIDPNSFNCHYNLAVAFTRQSRPRDAITHFREALRIDPNSPTAHYNLGLAQVAAGDSAAAIDSFRAALQRKPDYAEAHNDLGVALTNSGRLEEAVGHFQEALRLAPALRDAQYNL